MNPFQDAVGLVDLIGKLRATQPDLALSYSIKPATYGTLAAWAAGVPKRFAMIEGLGHVFMDTRSLKTRAVRAAVKELYRAALSRANGTLFLNPDDLNDFLNMRLISQSRAELVGGIGVDLEHWRPAPPVVQPMTFLFAGRLIREKGVEELIVAARRVKNLYPQTQFILLGDIDSNPSSLRREDIEAWVDEGIVAWPGHVDVAPWLRRASVFVLPSHREGLPRSTQEAMAMARPIITTDVPGCRETVVNGKNGFLVPVNDPDSLSDAMIKFIEVPSMVESMGNVSRIMAQENYDVRKINRSVISYLGL